MLATTAGLTFLVNNYVVKEKEMRQFTGHIVGFLAGSLFYPFQVARTNLSKTENFFPMLYHEIHTIQCAMTLYFIWM